MSLDAYIRSLSQGGGEGGAVDNNGDGHLHSSGEQQLLPMPVPDSTKNTKSPPKLANETWYLFGNNEHYSPFKELAAMYELPNCGAACSAQGLNGNAAAVVSGIGGVGSGVSFHFHGAGFSEAIFGRKRWFLYAPEYEPFGGFDANTTVDDWARSASFGSIKRRDGSLIEGNIPFRTAFPSEEEREQLAASLSSEETVACSGGSSSGGECATDTQTLRPPSSPSPPLEYFAGRFYDCTIGANEVLYFPSQWMHATLNLDPYTFFVSVFLP